MVIDSYKPFAKMAAELWLPMLVTFLYLLVIVGLDLQFHLEIYNFPIAIVGVMGTVIGLLLAFRTNASYQRWWEARILWGAIVNDSRTWVRQLLSFTQMNNINPAPDVDLRPVSIRQVAWCFALSRSLRKQQPTQDLEMMLSADEIRSFQSVHNIPNEILLRQAKELRRMYDAGRLELFQFIELEKTLTRLTNSMGGCERIKNTIFPTSYGRMVHALNYIFVAILPFGLVNVPAVGLVLTSMTLAFVFLFIEQVSVYLQDPFSNRPSDTPMLALSRTIEINIKQMLGDDDLPPLLTPEDGVLL